MKKVAFILVLSMVLSVLGITKEIEINVNAANATNNSTSSQGNIEITAKYLNVRQDKSTDSVIVSKVYLGEIYEVLDSGKDAQGKVWYKINAEFGVTGWVAGWYCKKTKESVNTAIESMPGKLYYECSKESLFIKLLLLEDYSLTKVLKVCGSNYAKNTGDYYVTYEYKDGTKIEAYENKEVITIEVGGRKFNVSQIQKVKADLLQNKGNEVIIFTGESLIIIEAKSKKIVREYHTGYMYLEEFKVGNFVGDNKLDLYLNGFNDYGTIRNIYEIVNNTFIRSYDMNSFFEYGKGIQAKIEKNKFKLDISIGNYKANEISVLPERVFNDTKDVKDKNDLLSMDPVWTVVQENGIWYIKVRYTVNLVMLNYYWGPPGDDIVYNEKMYNDLANIDIFLDLSSHTSRIQKVTHKIKYNDLSLNQVKPILYEEGLIVNGPKLGSMLEEAYKLLGGKLPEGYFESYEVNGVRMFEFGGQVINILVESSKYETTRGLKVGDDIKKVESLYGKPDVGFSGDPMVEYKFCYEGEDGKPYLNFYRSLNIYYKNGTVSAYEFSQAILD